ncbi:MAG TPA: HD-GYP domain-containing protein [Dehalococcoidia bacterium]|jgi:HD superfamily phosphodiesterase
MSLSARWWAAWSVVLGAPAAILFALLYLVPEWDKSFGTFDFHFFAVSAVTLAAAIACVFIIGLTQSLRETRVLFLGLGFLSIAGIFAVHGLGTPGHFHDEAYSELSISSWLSVLAGAGFIFLSSASLPAGAEAFVKRNGAWILGATAAAIGVYIGLSFAAEGWTSFIPYRDRNVQLAFTGLTLTLLGVSAMRYFQAFLFARLISQWAMFCLVVLLMEVQLSLTFGRYWQISWWMYHGLYGLAFPILFGAWFLEIKRAGSVNALAEALAMRDAVSQLNRGYSKPIAELVEAIEWKDLYTHGHVRRVASFAVMIGKEMGLSMLDLRNLALGAQLHDVGKISVPDNILSKPAKLTAEEFEVIKQHADRGWEIARTVKALEPAAEAIRLHHERWDGTGYPVGLSGDQIPLHARIVAVADAYDAMTSGRVYQPAVSDEQAFAELRRCKGTHFDPDCVEAFIKALDKAKAGEPVMLVKAPHLPHGHEAVA